MTPVVKSDGAEVPARHLGCARKRGRARRHRGRERALDAVGSTPFLRAVHAYERPQMNAVYRTYLDLSELLPPFVYAIILAFTGLGGVFVALGIFCATCAWISWRFLPRSM
jgi:hypothetical protein